MSITEWIINAKDEIIDSYFIQSAMKDINLTDAEKSQAAYFDSMASDTSGQGSQDVTPIGKLVL